MRRRIIICLALLLALCVAGEAIALWCLHRSIHQLSALVDSHRIQVLRVNLASAGVRIERDLLAHQAGHEHAFAGRKDSVDRFREAVERCGGCHHAPGVQSSLDRVRASFASYVASAEQLFAAADRPAGGKPVGAGETGRGQETEVLERDVNAKADLLVNQATEMADRAANHMRMRNTEAMASVRRAWSILLGTLVAALLAGGVVAFHLHRRLTTPVEALLAGIRRIRNGHPDHRISLEGDVEFRALGEALNDAYENLTKAQESVLQAEKMAAVGKLAAGVAHEVGNPLASISSVAQMMRRNCDDGEQAERLDLIMQHVGRVSRIVRELLTFARPTRDHPQGQVEINAVLDRAVSLLRYDKRAGRATINCRYDGGLCIERGDPDRLLTVFTNIIINAFDALIAHHDGDGRLSITARKTDDSIVVRFEDNGPGMTAEQIRNAFEPFFTTKEPGAGTGLGLWVCYQVVRAHEGTINIANEVGKGTAVVIELPIKTAAPNFTAERSRAPKAR